MKNFFKSIKIKRRIISLFYSFYIINNPSSKLKIIGVTGTNGKTTCTTLLYKICRELGYKAGLIGTVENIINDKKTPATHTTPDTPQLYRLLNQMINEGCEYVFMEVSSHALHQNRIAGIKFIGALFTNLTHDHLDYHKDFKNYFKAKRRMFKKLTNASFALTNIDDDYGERMISNTNARKFTYSFERPANFFGRIITINPEGITLNINDKILKSRLLGKFNAYNLLAVYGACKLLGFDLTPKNRNKLLSIFEKITPPPGRFEYFMSPKGVLIIIDYAHTPDALEKVILTSRGILSEGGRLITVFGCGGDRDPTKRATMGKIGTELSDIAILTSDNPRSEDPEKIIEEMKAELGDELILKTKTMPDRRKAIMESIQIAKKGDIILCAGKGHEDYQEIKGVKNHFDDMEEYKKGTNAK